MFIIRFLIIIFIFCSLLAHAQSDTQKKQKNSPENIESIDSKFSFAPYYVNEYSFISVNSRLSDRKSIYYKPNIIGSVGAKIGIKNFSIAYAFKLPQPQKYGTTYLTNLVLNLQRRLFGISLYYIRYNGLYLKNPQDFDIPYTMETYPIRPDISLTTFGFQTHFVFTKSFSINAAFQQNERQKKTAGSFMIMFGDRFSKLLSDSTLIVPHEQEYYTITQEITRLNLNTLFIAPGAGYSFIFKHHISFTTILLTGIGFQMKFYNSSSTDKFGIRLPLHMSSKSALGYNGRLFFCNLIYQIELNNIKFSDSKFTLFSNAFKVSVGFRIY